MSTIKDMSDSAIDRSIDVERKDEKSINIFCFFILGSCESRNMQIYIKRYYVYYRKKYAINLYVVYEL